VTNFPGKPRSSISRLVDAFHRLPGIGPKSAQRLAYHILRSSKDEARELAEALIEVKERTVLCSQCQQISDSDPCNICSDTRRERSVICVVEEPLDLVAIERTQGFHGLYHVLHGVISPADGVGPEHLKIQELLVRLRDGTFDGSSAVAEEVTVVEAHASSRKTRCYR
jgi:recombination protein RecR